MPATILYDVHDGIAIVTMNRPAALNALNRQARQELTAVWDEFEADDAVKVAILTGAGRAFSAGADLKEAAAEMAAGELSPDDFRVEQGPLPLRLKKPVIAAVNGVCAGGSVGQVGACDVAIASTNASFLVTFAARGLVSSMVLAVLARRMPPGWASWLALSGDHISAETARQIGFVNEVVAPERLLERAEEMAERITQAPLPTLLAIKEKLHTALYATPREAMTSSGPLEEAFRRAAPGVEGARAFVERRPSRFEGR